MGNVKELKGKRCNTCVMWFVSYFTFIKFSQTFYENVSQDPLVLLPGPFFTLFIHNEVHMDDTDIQSIITQ